MGSEKVKRKEKPKGKPRNRGLLIFQIILGLVVVSPFVFCLSVLGLLILPDIRISMAQRVYPGAEKFTTAYSFYGADSGLKAKYYWTDDPIEDVKAHYERFAFPFVIDQWDDVWITVFHPYGGELVAYDVTGKIERNHSDFMLEPRCNYQQEYACINVRLVDIATDGMDAVPDVAIFITREGDEPDLSQDYTTGTVIIHSYYVWDF